MSVFEVMDRDAWVESGAGQSAQKGEYAQILTDFLATGRRYANISTAADGNGRFAGKSASSISTALKGARDSKNAPEGADSIKVTSKSGVVFLENTSVEE